jgi:hypothetical protein
MKTADKQLNLVRLCQLLNVPIASYYYQPSDRIEEVSIIYVMKTIHEENLQSYGRRRMKVALEKQGTSLGEYQDITIDENSEYHRQGAQKASLLPFK